ncbi:MAG TPA: ferredoxin reductase, partial [Solirubrobacterales bacterium]|nr:ferredoxin reductase [Solirubrobacterales bacterium]
MATVATPELAPAPGRHFAEGRIRSVKDVASDVRMIEIEPAAGVRPYATGSHLDIAVDIDGLPDVRSYSLVGEGPVDGAYRIAVKEIHDSRGGSVWVRALAPDTTVAVSEPQSHFELQYGRSEYLLVAGGIGITPIFGMAHALERHGRPFRLLYAAHSREQMPFVEELSELLGDRLELFVSAEGNRLDIGGQIEQLHADGELYLCGPLRLRDAARHEWSKRERRPDRLQFETFASGGAFAPE